MAAKRKFAPVSLGLSFRAYLPTVVPAVTKEAFARRRGPSLGPLRLVRPSRKHFNAASYIRAFYVPHSPVLSFCTMRYPIAFAIGLSAFSLIITVVKAADEQIPFTGVENLKKPQHLYGFWDSPVTSEWIGNRVRHFARGIQMLACSYLIFP